jgi:hypothetical protein
MHQKNGVAVPIVPERDIRVVQLKMTN